MELSIYKSRVTFSYKSLFFYQYGDVDGGHGCMADYGFASLESSLELIARNRIFEVDGAAVSALTLRPGKACSPGYEVVREQC